MKDCRDAKTLGEACSNKDGTYNGYKLLSWLSKITSKDGIGIPEDEVKKLHKEVVKERKTEK